MYFKILLTFLLLTSYSFAQVKGRHFLPSAKDTIDARAAAVVGDSLDALRAIQVVNAADYGFHPDSTGAQNKANLQSALDGGDVTVVVSRPGIYFCEGRLYMDDYTELVFGQGVWIQFVPVASPREKVIWLTNRGAPTRTRNYGLYIRNLQFSDSTYEAYAREDSMQGSRGRLTFLYVTDLQITGFRCYDVFPVSTTMHLLGWKNLLVEDFIIHSIKNGIIIGSGEDGIIRDGYIDSFDDAMAIVSTTYGSSCPIVGDIKRLLVENITDMNIVWPALDGVTFHLHTGSWTEWYSGIGLVPGDFINNNDKVYQLYMPSSNGALYTSTTAPTHTFGCDTTADDLVWLWRIDGDDTTATFEDLTFRNITVIKDRNIFQFDWVNFYSFRSVHPEATRPPVPTVRIENLNDLLADSSNISRIVITTSQIDIEMDNIKTKRPLFGSTYSTGWPDSIDTDGDGNLDLDTDWPTGGGSDSIAYPTTHFDSKLSIHDIDFTGFAGTPESPDISMAYCNIDIEIDHITQIPFRDIQLAYSVTDTTRIIGDGSVSSISRSYFSDIGDRIRVGGIPRIYGKWGWTSLPQDLVEQVTFDFDTVLDDTLEGILEGVAGETILLDFGDGTDTTMTLNGTTDIDIYHAYTDSSGNYELKFSGSLDSLTKFRIASDGAAISGSVADASKMSGVTYYDVRASKVHGSLEAFEDQTQYTHLFLNNTSVRGDVSSLAGMTSMVQLYLYGSPYISGNISSFAAMTGMLHLQVQATDLTGDLNVISNYSSLVVADIHGMLSDSLDYSDAALPAWGASDIDIDFTDNGLSAAEIDTFFINLADSCVDCADKCSVDVSDNVAPTANSAAARTTLTDSSWVLTTD